MKAIKWKLVFTMSPKPKGYYFNQTGKTQAQEMSCESWSCVAKSKKLSETCRKPWNKSAI